MFEGVRINTEKAKDPRTGAEGRRDRAEEGSLVKGEERSLQNIVDALDSFTPLCSSTCSESVKTDPVT